MVVAELVVLALVVTIITWRGVDSLLEPLVLVLVIGAGADTCICSLVLEVATSGFLGTDCFTVASCLEKASEKVLKKCGPLSEATTPVFPPTNHTTHTTAANPKETPKAILSRTCLGFFRRVFSHFAILTFNHHNWTLEHRDFLAFNSELIDRLESLISFFF